MATRSPLKLKSKKIQKNNAFGKGENYGRGLARGKGEISPILKNLKG